jgi:hypothetical protein
LQKNVPFMQSHVTFPYVHGMTVEHMSPAIGCVVGQGELQCQASPPPPAGPAKPPQRQVVPLKSHWRPAFVHIAPSVGCVVGHVPQLHIPPTHAQSSIP